MTVTQNTDMEPKNMHGAAHLIDRDGVYYFKRRIPQSLIDALAQLAPETVELVPSELRQIFVGKEFVRYSLKTKLKKHALNLLMQAELDFNSNQELLETWLCTSALQYDTPSDDALRAMASLWVENQLKIDDEQRLDPGKSLELVHLEKGMHLMEPHYKSLLAVGGAEKRDHWVEGVVVELQKEYSIRLDPESRTTQLLRREVAMGILRIYEVIRARNGGNVVPTPQAVSTLQSVEIAHKSQRTTESAGKAVTLGEVETRYLKGQNQNSYTRKIVGAVTLFADVIGRECPIHSLRQREVTDFLHDICNLPADWVKQRAKGVPLAKLLAD